MLRAARVRLKNIAGVDELEFQPGTFTVVSGQNEAGKSSVLRGIKAIAEGGHDATLLRKGAERGEAVIEFADDDGEILTAARRYGLGGSTLTVTNGQGAELSQPQTFVNKLWDALSANPIEFLEADPKTRLKLLLEALPLEIPEDNWAELMAGVDAIDFSQYSTAYDRLAALHKFFYLQRRDTNRSLDEKQKTIKTLESDLPRDEAGDYAAQIRELTTQQTDIETAREAAKDQAQAAYNAAIEEAQKVYDQARKAAAEAFLACKEEMDREYGPRLQEQAVALARLEEQARQAERIKGTRETIGQLKQQAKEVARVLGDLEWKLRRLQALKEQMLSGVPIKGLTIEDGEIHLNGVAWKSLAFSQRLRVAVHVSRLRARDIGLICIDGAEAFDQKNFKALEKLIKAEGLQAITARVAPEGALKVETDGKLPFGDLNA